MHKIIGALLLVATTFVATTFRPQANGGQANVIATAVLGVATNSNASAGFVGEIITSTQAAPGPALTTATTANVTSISLTAGDWDVTGSVDFRFGATTSYTNLIMGISTTSATLGAQDTFSDYATSAIVPTAAFDMSWDAPIIRISIASTTTVFLVAQGTFTVSTLNAYGTIRARRMR